LIEQEASDAEDDADRDTIMSEHGSYRDGDDDPAYDKAMELRFVGFELKATSKILGVTLETAQAAVFQAAYKQAIAHQHLIPATTIEIRNVTSEILPRRALSSTLEITIAYSIFSATQEFADMVSAKVIDAPALTTEIKDDYAKLGGDATMVVDLLVEDFSVPEIAVLTAGPTLAPTAINPGLTSYEADDDGSYGRPPAEGQYHLNPGAHLTVVAAGVRYTEGEEVSIGVNVPAWSTPAKLVVTSVDEAGGLISLDVVDGGHYAGDNGAGNYDLSPVEASLLLMARSGGEKQATTPTTAQSKSTKSNAPAGLPADKTKAAGFARGSLLLMSAATGLMVLVAAVTVGARRRASSALQETNTTPAADGDSSLDTTDSL
jgi:hypothetical protein